MQITITTTKKGVAPRTVNQHEGRNVMWTMNNALGDKKKGKNGELLELLKTGRTITIGDTTFSRGPDKVKEVKVKAPKEAKAPKADRKSAKAQMLKERSERVEANMAKLAARKALPIETLVVATKDVETVEGAATTGVVKAENTQTGLKLMDARFDKATAKIKAKRPARKASRPVAHN
jgi:hypothetical protein